MKSLIYVCLVLLALVAAASADPEKLVVGPYNISFDLGTDLNYSVEVLPPLEGNNSTGYTALINVQNETRVGIYINDMKSPADATLETLKEKFQSSLNSSQNPSVEIGKIDGRDGLITYYLEPSRDRQIYYYIYWLDSKTPEGSSASTGSIDVRIYGYSPLNSTHGMDIAKSLLNTINITKASEAAMPASLSEVRPSPYIRTHNQNAEDQQGAVFVDEAYSDGPGWLVIFNQKSYPYQGLIYSPIGQTQIEDGLNRNVRVDLNMALISPRLYAVICKDEGALAKFEFNGPDYPFNRQATVYYSFYGIWPYPNTMETPDWLSLMSHPHEDWL